MTEHATDGAVLDIEVTRTVLASLYIEMSEENCANLVSIAKGLLAEVDRLREQMRWIPVEERLPEVTGRYLVWEKDYGRVIMIGRDGSWSLPDVGTEWGGIVTHWMPLPESPAQEP